MDQRTNSVHTGPDIAAKRGLLEVSRDHECIFTLVRVFFSLARLGSDATRLLALFEKINEQTVSHFNEEENMLRQLGHPGFASQCADHRRILDELTLFRDRMAAGRIVLTSEYLHLFDPLIIHYIREEQTYSLDQVDRSPAAAPVVWQ